MSVIPTFSSGVALQMVNPSRYWLGGTITYGFPTPGGTDNTSVFSYTDEPGASGYAALDSVQQSRFVTAITAWDRLIPQTLVLNTNPNITSQIRIAFTNFEDIQQDWGYAYGPPVNGVSTTDISGDIWINAKFKDTSFPTSGYDYSSLLHEIGHALGLGHSFDAVGFDLTYDSTTYTVMSYTEAPQYVIGFIRTSTGLLTNHQEIFAQTPMVLDIAAIQDRYGVSTGASPGDNVYTWADNTYFLYSIFDSSGNDTFDASAQSRMCIIDLTPGSYSSIGMTTIPRLINYYVGLYGEQFRSFITQQIDRPDTYTWTNNVGIAFSTTIENAKGGAGDDTLTGNTVANRLEGANGADSLFGMGGDDFLIGGAGNDTLDGGAGSDIASYAIASSGATVTAGSTSGSWTITSSLGTDTLTGVETVRFTDKDFLATPTPTPTPTATPGNSWHDWNGDGISDILWRDTTSGLIATTASGPGGGTLTYIAVVPPEWVIQTVADFDGDHKADILWRSNTGQVVIWNSGPLGHVDHPTMATTWTIQGSADFNNDGKSDLVWHNSATGEARIWTTGGGGFASTSLGNFAPEWRVESAGDFRNDGYGDILWRNGNTGDMLYFDFTATSIGGVGVGKLDLAFTVETCADFTGDGRDDMLIRHANGDLLVWHENGFSSAGNRSSAWSVSYADDFNGDGLADILWRHTGGEAQLWSATSTAGQFTVAVLGQLPLTIQAF